MNRGTIPTGIVPLRFNALPSRGIPLPSVSIEITPEELEAVFSDKLALPQGWSIDEEISRDAVGNVNGVVGGLRKIGPGGLQRPGFLL